MELRYTLLDPSGNTTALVRTAVAREVQADIAAQVMARIPAEQVGYIEPATRPGARARLQMMGGEFCGNASMALAALLAMEAGIGEEEERQLSLEVSGAEGLVDCHVRREGTLSFRGSVSMPLPDEIGEYRLPNGLLVPLLRFPGITQLILPEGALSPTAAQTEIAGICASLEAQALGLLFTDSDAVRMRPLVYVRSTDSAVWECACGSGTAALGAWMALRTGKDISLQVDQPGGSIGVHARCAAKVLQEISIQGKVKMLSEGELKL